MTTAPVPPTVLPRPGNRRPRLFRRLALAAAVLLPAGLLSVVPAGPASAATNPCGPPVTSVIACENTKPGYPAANWQETGAGDSTIQGFATQMSVNVGQTVSLKVSTTATKYHVNILRIGYYGGTGARLVAANLTPTATLPQKQPACLTSPDGATGLIDCGNWAVSAQWAVPSDAVSGVYMAQLVRDDTGGYSLVPFVVRDDASHADIIYQLSDETMQAYNTYGGNSLYQCTVSCPPGNPGGYKAAFEVSYNRPFHSALDDNGRSWFFWSEFPLVQFLERNGYDIAYTDAGQVDAQGSLLPNHKIFVSSAHDEYWSGNQRASVENGIKAGMNAAFFSGNEVFWKTRFAPSADGSNTPNRTIVCYKETHFDAPTDPRDPPTWTGTWADPRFSPPADGGRPQNALTGQLFIVNHDGFGDAAGNTPIQVPAAYSKLRFWRNTAVAGLAAGQVATLAPRTLGYEWDMDADDGFRPPGTFDLSSTTVSGVQAFVDYGTYVNNNSTVTHNMTLYRAPSGALVFGAGTVQWAFGLDSSNPFGNPVDVRMQQATVNLFADMSNVQPATLASGLVTASASTDTTAPTSRISSLSPSSPVADGTSVTVSGTATDSGGVVAGVEISTDGGTTWHPARLGSTGAGSSVTWSYTWLAHGAPSTTVRTRATDDSGNIESPTDAQSVTVSCPCSLWGDRVTPSVVDSGDGNAAEVGVKFQSDTFGTITGLRFYKATANTGTHIGNLWSADGALLASATFTGETASGWQQVSFAKPVAILPNTTYVASYFAPKGHFADDSTYFYPAPNPAPAGGGIVDSPPLHAVRATGGTANGVFAYTLSSTFPSNDNGDATNYWVDPVFGASSPPGQATNVTATPANNAANVSWTAPSTGGPATAYTVTPYVGSTAQKPVTVTGNPAPTTTVVSGLTNGTTYTFTVTAQNPLGSGPASPPSANLTPAFIPTFVQAASGHVAGATKLSVTPTSSVTAPDRLIVAVGVWGSGGATAKAVTDSAGNTYVEVTHVTNSDGTEQSIWTAPVSNGSGTRPQVTATTTVAADIGVQVLEYSALSTAVDATAVDQVSTATGLTGTTAATVSSGAVPAVRADNSLVVGFYSDSGFGNSLTTGTGYTLRSNMSPLGDMEMLAEDATVNQAATPAATAGTGPRTYWEMAAVVFKPGGVPTAPGTPTGVTASSGPGSATVTWTAPPNNGSPITSYTVTPYVGGVAQAATTVAGSPPATSVTVNNLTNGTAYTFTVRATNAVGTGPASTASAAVTPSAPAAPGAPTGVSAAGGDSSATVSWTAPASNGGSPITGYTVTPYLVSEGNAALPPVPVNGNPPATRVTVSGLTNGSTYAFTVTATNAVGTGPASAQSNSVSPNTLPAAPTGVTATAGDAAATVSWTPPAGASGTISGYTVTPYVGTSAQTATTVSGAVSTATVAGLTNGTTYTFTVATVNSIGTGPASSPSNPVTPSPAGPPGAPTGVSATAGNASATVTWVPPASNGSSPITSYTVIPFVGSVAQPTTVVPGTTTTTTVSGLANGTAYTFTVTATNANGTGPSSAPSAAVSPAGQPPAPTGLRGTAGDGSATLSWSLPSNGGSPVTGYTITPYVGTTAKAAVTITGTATNTTLSGLTNGVTYAFTVAATNAAGTGTASAPSNLVTPSAGPSCPCSLFGSTTPSSVDSYDGSGIEVGVQFTSDTAGYITGIRFFKAGTNTGTHSGHLWSSDGQLLASVTFAGETASGWQQATFSTPVPVTPGVRYVASYYAPVGHYSTTAGQFASDVVNPPLYARNSGVTANGVFAYAAASAFPTNSWGDSNYWVDPVFNPTLPGPPAKPTAVSAVAGSGSATVRWTAPASGGSPITSYTVTPYIGSTAQPATTVSGNPPATSATVSGLADGTSYTFTVAATNANGTGPASTPSAAVTIGALPPAAPSAVTAGAGAGSATVSWTAPASNGSAVTSYTVTPYIGSTAQPATTVSGSPPATSATVNGLANGTTYTFVVTATNANGTGVPSAASNPATPRATAPSCPCTLFGTAAPSLVDSGDASGITLGVKVVSDTDGYATGVRFYKATTNTGTHTGQLWTLGGQLLASVTFSNETASGWQQATFSSPVSVTAGTTYVVSYFAPYGHYSATSGAFATAGVNAPPLYAPATATTANGIYSYSGQAAFPTSTWNGTSYGVDLLFAVTAPAVPAAPTGVTATAAGSTSATVTWTAPTSGGGAITSYTVTPYLAGAAQAATTVTGTPPATSATVSGLTAGGSYTFTVSASNGNGTGPASAASTAITLGTVPAAPTAVAASAGSGSASLTWTAPSSSGGTITSYTVTPYIDTTAQPATTVSGAPAPAQATVSGLANGTTYTFTVTATNANGTGPVSTRSNPVTPRTADPTCPCTILGTTAPATADFGDSSSLELGVKFTSDRSGYVTGIRFFKSAANTGTHTGNLWSASGQLLGSVTFSGETASGWQQALFSNPVAVTAGTTYIASYFDPKGHYAATPAAFATGTSNPPLYATASSVSPNGVYAYSSTSSFPASSYNGTSYWVDPVFDTKGTPPPPAAPTGVAATAGSGSVTLSWTPPTDDSITGYTITPYVGSTAQPATTISGSSTTTTATVSGLTNGTTYTFTVAARNSTATGPASAPSNPATPQSSAPACPCTVFGTTTPSVVDAGDGGAVTLGMKFTSDTAGHITGLRFYKSAANTGTHVGSLWSASGQLLATVAFSNETASGWQQASFSTPVAISAGQAYVVSYFAPNGHYAATGAAFASGGIASPPLHAVSNTVSANGVYTYGSTSSFPTSSYNATNYWVDPVFGP